MLKSLLVASDLSTRSEPALHRAVQLATATGARLSVLHAVEDDQPKLRMQDEMRSAQAYLDWQLDALGRPAGAEVITRAGDPFQVIDQTAQACAADLIVMGAHRRRILRDVFVGTTIERVTRTAGRPVLMAHDGPAYPWKRVFIATDLSETSAEAARRAHALGFLQGADVTFIHAYTPIVGPMMTYAGITSDRVSVEAEREFQTARRDVARFVHDLGIGDPPCHARLLEGLGASAITGFVAQARPHLLVIGTRGLSGTKRLLLGSIAQELMGSLSVDILAVPPPA